MSAVLSFDSIFDRRDPEKIPPWEISLEQFLFGHGGLERADVDDRYVKAADPIAMMLPGLVLEEPAFAYGMIAAGHFLIRETVAQDATLRKPYLVAVTRSGDPVGAYVAGDLFVKPDYRNCGVGAELFLARAVLHNGGRHDGRSFTSAGLSTGKAAHRLAVEYAHLHGLTVPPGPRFA